MEAAIAGPPRALLGREAERDAIGALLDDARAGRSAALVLRGGPGLGKTALLDDAARRGEGLRVLRATGAEAEAGLPFAGLHQLLRPVLDLAAALPAPQAAALRRALGLEAGPPPAPLLLGAATLGLLAEAAPVLALVDDGHWLDAASAAALAFAAPAPPAPRASRCWSRSATTHRRSGLAELRARAPRRRGGRGGAARRHGAGRPPAALDRGGGGQPARARRAARGAQRRTSSRGARRSTPALPPSRRGSTPSTRRGSRRSPATALRPLLIAAAEGRAMPALVLRAAEEESAPSVAPDGRGALEAERAGCRSAASGSRGDTRSRAPAVLRARRPRASCAAAYAALAAVADPDRAAWYRAAAAIGPDAGAAEALAAAGERGPAAGPGTRRPPRRWHARPS